MEDNTKKDQPVEGEANPAPAVDEQPKEQKEKFVAKIKRKKSEFVENHPVVTKIIKGVTVTLAIAAGAAFGLSKAAEKAGYPELSDGNGEDSIPFEGADVSNETIEEPVE